MTKTILLEPCKLSEHKQATEDQTLPLPLPIWLERRATLQTNKETFYHIQTGNRVGKSLLTGE